jgi:hypothetical protein
MLAKSFSQLEKMSVTPDETCAATPLKSPPNSDEPDEVSEPSVCKARKAPVDSPEDPFQRSFETGRNNLNR